MLDASRIILAQVDTYQAEKLNSLWVWLGVLVLLLVMLGLGIAILKKTMGGVTDPADRGEPFSLHDLRQMHRDGQITDEQFERARARILALHAGRPAEDASEDDGITDISHEFTEDHTPHNDADGPAGGPDRA